MGNSRNPKLRYVEAKAYLLPDEYDALERAIAKRSRALIELGGDPLRTAQAVREAIALYVTSCGETFPKRLPYKRKRPAATS